MLPKTLSTEVACKVKSIIANDDVNGMHLLIAGGLVDTLTLIGGVSLLGMAVRCNSRAVMESLRQMGWRRGLGHISNMRRHELSIRNECTLWACGDNEHGQLGDGSTIDRLQAIHIMDHVKSVSAGHSHSLAVREDDTLWAWGWNEYGQLGDGSTTNRLKPVQVMSSIRAVTAGYAHSLALREDGTVWAWGRNEYGQLGDGSTKNRSSPIRVLSNACAVTAGRRKSLAVGQDGTLWVWGEDTRSCAPKAVVDNVCDAKMSANETIYIVREDGVFWPIN